MASGSAKGINSLFDCFDDEDDGVAPTDAKPTVAGSNGIEVTPSKEKNATAISPITDPVGSQTGNTDSENPGDTQQDEEELEEGGRPEQSTKIVDLNNDEQANYDSITTHKTGLTEEKKDPELVMRSVRQQLKLFKQKQRAEGKGIAKPASSSFTGDFIPFNDPSAKPTSSSLLTTSSDGANATKTGGVGNSAGDSARTGGVSSLIEEDDVAAAEESNTARRPPWTKRKTTKIRHPLLRLHQEVIDFYDFIKPTEEDYRIRRDRLQQLTNMVHDLWPNADVEPFGSFATGLYLPAGDIDVVVFLRGNVKTMQKTLAAHLVKKEFVHSIEVIPNAKVPLIKLVDRKYRIHMDISFNAEDGVKNIERTKNFLLQYPELPYLLFVIKAFLRQRSLHETYYGGIGSFLLQTLIVSYLQNHPLKEESNDRVLLSHYLLGFFELYGLNFNYRDVGISIVDGGRYFAKRDHGKIDDRHPYALCVESPSDPSHDIGHAAFNIMKIQKALYQAYNRLVLNCYDQDSILSLIIDKDNELFKASREEHVDEEDAVEYDSSQE